MNKFADAEAKLDALLATEVQPAEALSYKAVWLRHQIFKTQFQRGHFKKALDSIVELLEKLDEKYGLIQGVIVTPRGEQPVSPEERDSIEFYYFKLLYTKAKIQRKMRLLKSADETCQYLIDTVKEK